MPHCLQDKTITKIEIASDSKALRFFVDGEDGPVIAKADGDCCSESWIEHVETPALGFPATVWKVADLDLPVPYKHDKDGERFKVYGLRITTDKGDIVIDYRNASNGYYGGDLVWPDEDFYGGVRGQNVSNEEWKSLVEVEEA